MQFILKLFKEIISALSKIYTKAEVDSVLETKLEVSEFEEAVETETSAMYEAYEEQVGGYEALDARSKALANIAKWRSYASAMQSMVDDEMATMIAEEFEKAAQKYLEDPEATEEWIVTKVEDGVYSSTSPYSEEAPTRPVVNFNVIRVDGYYSSASAHHGVFHKETSVPVFLPRLESAYKVFMYTSFSSVICLPNLITSQQLFQGGTATPVSFSPKVNIASYMFRHLSLFNRKVILPFATKVNSLCESGTSFNSELNLPMANDCAAMLSGAKAFNQPLSLPSATICSNLLQNCLYFNQSLSVPKATKCGYMLQGATNFNQPLYLPEATDCSYLLYQATSYNQPLSLPKATTVSALLWKASAFNSTLDLPVAGTVNHLLSECKSFNQPLELPEATICNSMLEGASSFNQPLSLPKATNVGYILAHCVSFNSSFSAPKAWMWKCAFNGCKLFNQPIDVSNAINSVQMLKGCSSFNQPLNLPVATDCSDMLLNATSFNSTISIPKATNCDNMLSGATSFNQSVELTSCTSASGAFNNTALTFDHISDILMSLPETAGGVISFVGTPGSDDPDIEFDMEPAIVDARRKGWTVEF